MSPLPIAEDDAAALARLFERMLGHGFRLAVVELGTPAERASLSEWITGILSVHDGLLIPVDLRELPAYNLWQELHARLDPLPARAVLLLYGLETTERRSVDAQAGLLRQLNVQRDVLVRDFPVPWVLVLHPTLYTTAMEIAPDFMDYAVRQVPAARGVGGASTASGAPLSSGAFEPLALGLPALPLPDPESEVSLLVAQGWAHLQRWELDAARDVISRLDLRRPLGPPLEAARRILMARHGALTGVSPGGSAGDASADELLDDVLATPGPLGGIAALFAAESAGRRGEVIRAGTLLDQAIGRLEEDPEWGPVARLLEVERAGARGVPIEGRLRALITARRDDGWRAELWGRVADELVDRGEFDEALRIRREEELPVYMRLGDAHRYAVAQGKVANVLQARGEFDAALRIRREEELPVYRRLGDVRGQAVAMGTIADVLQARGELDEALRIRREEQVPIYKRLGDVRALAITMGKVADVLQARGELDAALRLRQDEEVPVYRRIGDLRALAVAMDRIAQIRFRQGDLDEAIRVCRSDVLPILERLRSVRNLPAARMNLALYLRERRNRGTSPDRRRDRDDARHLLRLALVDAERMNLPEAAQVRALLNGRDAKEEPRRGRSPQAKR